MAAKKTWKRARKPAQKAERRREILKAAAALLDAGGLDATGLNAIARQAGIAKANIYRYFESREAVLLELLLDEERAFLSSLHEALRPLAGSADSDAVAAAFATAIVARPRFCVLFAALAGVLEQNVSADTVLRFKRAMQGLLPPVLEALVAAVPALGLEGAYRFSAQLVMAAGGFWPHCHPAPVVQEVIARPEFAAMRFDFESLLRAHGAALLRGMLPA